MTTKATKILWTKTDEAPALATYSFLPIVNAFTKVSGVSVELRDISLAGRIIAAFPENLTAAQKQSDDLAELGKLATTPEANIIKLPNISASVPQLNAAIKELQAQGYKVPDYPEDPKTDEEKAIKARYAKVLGSAVNPVLREGNSDRRAPLAVKHYARKHPHSMGEWTQASKTHVAQMTKGRLLPRSNEKSMTLDEAREVRMEFVGQDGKTIVLKPKVALKAGEIIDAMFMSKKALCEFYEARDRGCQKAGRAVLAARQGDDDEGLAPDRLRPCRHGLLQGRLRQARQACSRSWASTSTTAWSTSTTRSRRCRTINATRSKRDLHAGYEQRPELAMVDSAKGITNLHAPNDVIVDASMPAMIRNCGKMWGADGKLKDTKAVIPDGTFARIYQEMINFCKTNGNFDPKTMGTVPNVGLMAQQAEEYGSHDKTFESAEATARSASSARRARACWRRTSRPATSGACARSRTPRSATGSSWPSPARTQPARRRSSGSTRTARTSTS
ncbi:MAG: NADP-dependent isocitrate dehydrogenase [Candidatus Manganitrophus sp.]|nr:MAG: NADP-dependent isocitrate dehydrogenase [Candidatus Manganitrophus sp.]